MWSDLLDEKGRKRASIFYKAVFYDRSAHMSLNTRFGISRDYEREENESIAVCYVMDGNEAVYTTEPIQLPEDDHEKYNVAKQADREAAAWLDENYPDWRNPGAYWD